MSQTFSPNAGLGMWIIWTASLVQNNGVFVNLGASLSTWKPCRPVLFCFPADAFVTGLAVSRLVRALWPPNRSKPLVIVVQLFSITPHADLVHQLVKKHRNVFGVEVGFLHLGSLASSALLTKATYFSNPFPRPSIQAKVKHNQHPFGGPCLFTSRAFEPCKSPADVLEPVPAWFLYIYGIIKLNPPAVSIVLLQLCSILLKNTLPLFRRHPLAVGYCEWKAPSLIAYQPPTGLCSWDVWCRLSYVASPLHFVRNET